jgi:hypothetical protein
MRPLLKTNMEIETIQQQTTAQNQSNVGRYLRKKPIQFCLAWVPCILCIPLLTFILQLLNFVRDDLGIVKNELVVNDIYFENLCDSENMLVRLNISQRWNATFDVYLSDATVIVLNENSEVEGQENIFKLELLPVTSGTIQPTKIQNQQPNYEYLAAIPKEYEKQSPTNAKIDAFDAENINSGVMTFKISSENVNVLKSLISNLKVDTERKKNTKNVISIRIKMKIGFSRFRDLLFGFDFTTPKATFPLANVKLKTPCEKCNSRKVDFKKNPPTVKNEKKLKSRATKLIMNSIEMFGFSNTNCNIAMNGIPNNIYIKGDSNFKASMRIMAGMQNLPLFDINLGSSSSTSKEKDVTPSIKSWNHGAFIAGLSMDQTIHEKGILLATDKIINATLHHELKQQVPIFVKGEKTHSLPTSNDPKNICFLQEIISSISYKLAIDHPLNGKIIENKTLSEAGKILSQQRANQNKCQLEDENSLGPEEKFCSLNQSTRAESANNKKNVSSSGSSSILDNLSDLIACIPKTIESPSSESAAATTALLLTWKSDSFLQCLTLANDYSFNGLENVKAPIIWVEEISTGAYIKFTLTYARNSDTKLLIKIKFGSAISSDGFVVPRILQNIVNGVHDNLLLKFPTAQDNSFLFIIFSRLIVDVVSKTFNNNDRAVSFCKLLLGNGKFGTLRPVGNALEISYSYVLELPSALNSVLPDIDVGDFAFKFYGVEKVADVIISGKYLREFMKTSIQLEYKFSLQKNTGNTPSSTSRSRFWGKILSGSPVPVTLKLNHRNLKIKFPFNIPAGLLSANCTSEDAKVGDNSLISNAKITDASFDEGATCGGGIYNIEMQINNMLPFSIGLPHESSNIACAYLYENEDMGGTIYSIGCGQFTAANGKLNDIAASESVVGVTLNINNTIIVDEYKSYRDHIGNSSTLTSTWGVSSNAIVDGLSDSYCPTLRNLHKNNALKKYYVSIVAKSVLEFQQNKMQVDNLIFPSQTFKTIESESNVKLQYDKLPDKFNDEKMEFVDLVRWNEYDENYGNIDASSMFEELDNSALIAAFKIEGAGFVLLVLCCILGCCGTCYSCCAIMSNCRLCPWYKKLYTTNNNYDGKQHYNFNSVATSQI